MLSTLEYKFIQLSQTLTKLCHIKRDYLVHIICSKCPLSAERRVHTRDLRIVFFVRIESRIKSAVRFVFESNPRIESAGTIRQQLFTLYTYSEYLIHRYFVFVTNESDVRTTNWVLVYFNSVIKSFKQCCCTLILLPKSTLNANLTTTNRFFTNDDWQRGRFENFESDHQYKSNLESVDWAWFYICTNTI